TSRCSASSGSGPIKSFIGCDLRFSCRPSPRRIAGAFFSRLSCSQQRGHGGQHPLHVAMQLPRPCPPQRPRENAPHRDTQTTVMKAIAAALLLAAGVTSVAAAKTAADFPSRPVRLLVPFAAGGPTDVVARILADLLSVRWGGQSVVIENRPGAGTIVATAAL